MLIWASLSPSELSITARFSRSARICFSIASNTSFGGEMFLISYRSTLIPHGSEALSSSLTTATLRLVRSSKVRSSSILPNSLRRVVCASCVMANSKFAIPYAARSASNTFMYKIPSTRTCTLSRVIHSCSGMSTAFSFNENL